MSSKTWQPYDDRAGRVLECIDHSNMLTQAMRHQWFDALAFVRGDQWGFWDAGLGRMRQRPALPWKVRITDNQVLALIMQQLGILLEKSPTFTAFGRTDDDQDRQEALGVEALFLYQWDRLDLDDELEEVLKASLTTGNGFWRGGWDEDAGESIVVPRPSGSGMAAAKGAPTAEDDAANAIILPDGTVLDEGVPVGDVFVRYVSPFAMHVDPAATKLRNARWAAQESFVHMDTLRDLLGSKAVEGLVPDVEGTAFYAYELAQRADQSILAIGDVRDMVRVTEWWSAPTKAEPLGKVVTVACGRALDVKDNPFGGMYPWVHFPCIKVDGSFWAEGFVKHLRPLAVMHNRNLSSFQEIVNLMGRPKYVADKLAGLKETALNDRPGEVVTINPGGELRVLPAAPPPQGQPQMMSMALNSMQTVSGINDPLAGNNPSNVRSGRSLAFLQEGALRRFIPISKHVESGLRQTGRLLLHLFQRFYTEDRLIHLLGPNQEPQVKAISAAGLARVAGVTVASGSMLPQSKAAKQDLVLDLLQNAPAVLMDDTGRPDKARIFRILDMPSVSGRQDPDDADRMRAQREHEMIRRGEVVQPSPWENPAVHMAEHRRELLSARAEADPEYRARLAAHFLGHQAAAAPATPPAQPGAPGAATPPGAAAPGVPAPLDNPLLAGFLQQQGAGGGTPQTEEPGAENMLGPRSDMPGGSR